MYVTDLEISDLRSFRRTQRVSLDRGDGTYAGWTVFAGRNGAGKSTLLKALALSIVGPLAARSLAGSFPAWVRKDASVARVATSLIFDSDHDAFQGSGNTPYSPIWSGLEWKANPGGSDAVERAVGENERGVDRGPWHDAPRGWFVAGYGPYRHLGPVTAEIIQKTADPVVARLINLFNESATLSEAVDWLKHQHHRALEKKPGAAELRDAVLALLGDGLLPDGSIVDHVDSDGLWLTRDGVTLHLEQVSDGYRTTTALVVDLVRRLHATYGYLGLEEKGGHQVCPLPGVVLIDEVDAHLHVAWQQNLGFWLTSRFPAIQFLVTTHSPFICQAASPRGIIRLPAPGEDRQMEHVDDRLYKAIVNGGADDAVMSELFGLEHAHSRRAEELRDTLAKLEGKVIDGTASTEERTQYVEIKQQLPESMDELADQSVRALLARSARP
jgi:energy-coupling factor transporter ATP-binding protein EcfA2